MSIKFSCPHCQKVLNVKDQFAGKRALCPGCKKPLTVPAPVAKPADMEAVAAALLADAPAPAAPAPVQSKLDFTCPFCDEKISVSADLAGKRTPCPECKRIVKVPEPEDNKPKDWRQMDTRRPSAARPEPGGVPEGTWGTRDAGTVSAESLIEADAVPQLRQRLTWQQWVRRGLVAVLAVSVVSLGAWIILRSIARYRKDQFLARALQAANSKSMLGPESAAELHHALGDYYLAENKPEEARNHFRSARAATGEIDGASSNGRDLALIDILLSQVELGGDRADVEKGTRLKWDAVLNEIRQTSQNLRAPEARAMALRLLTRKLIGKGQESPTRLATQFSEDIPQLLAVIGQESSPANKEALAKQALAQLPKATVKPGEQKANPEEKAKGPPPPAALISLLVALRKDKEAAAIAPLPEGEQPDTAVLVGYVEGWARRGEMPNARKRANEARFPIDRFQARLAVAEVAVENEQLGDARTDLELCLQLAAGELKGKITYPWLLFRLVRLSARAGLADKALSVAGQINDAGLRGRAQLEVLRQRLSESKSGADESSLQMVDKESPAHSLALEIFTRHGARVGGYGAVQKFVESWDPPRERPLGDVGIALGLQDSGK
jgi:hypothetical protein